MQYENTFKQIDQILWKEPGCSSELDYLEQKSWLLFLKYLEDFENDREEEAELDGRPYHRLITGFNRWSVWAAPKKNGELDIVNAMTGDTLVEFVDQKLFPYLKHFKDTAADSNTLEYKIGEIFDELHNKIRSGFNMREIINMVDALHFQSAEDKHEMTVLYESNIQRMGTGRYSTPPSGHGIVGEPSHVPCADICHAPARAATERPSRSGWDRTDCCACIRRGKRRCSSAISLSR